MNALIFAILTCTAGSGGVCLDNYPVRFHSAQDCLTFLTRNMAHGRELTNGRAYANNSHSVWFECDQKPTSEWQAVQPSAPVSHAAPSFKAEPYALMRCVGSACVRASSVTSVSAKACAFAKDLAAEYDKEMLIDPTISYECVSVP